MAGKYLSEASSPGAFQRTSSVASHVCLVNVVGLGQVPARTYEATARGAEKFKLSNSSIFLS